MNKLFVGLMSGTSLDGIDAALVEISNDGITSTIHTLAVPYSNSQIEELHKIISLGSNLPEISAANVALGILHADAVNSLLEKSEHKSDQITAIGFHGQTIHHLPDSTVSLKMPVRATWQLGDPAILCEKTGIDVVSNFRSRDMAAGGQGAPLVPLFDYHVLHDSKKNQLALNIGGIANVTFLPKEISEEAVIAFDTGPGNCLIDLATEEFTEGISKFDLDGTLAAEGVVDQDSLDSLMKHNYFKRKPPKSTGRELFNLGFITKADLQISGNDLIATLTAFTAKSIARAIERHWPGEEKPEEIIVSGGGVHNITLLNMLKAEMPDAEILSSAASGIDPDFKEAIAFAYLSHQTISGKPGNLPSATGADRAVVLGSITKY